MRQQMCVAEEMRARRRERGGGEEEGDARLGGEVLQGRELSLRDEEAHGGKERRAGKGEEDGGRRDDVEGDAHGPRGEQGRRPDHQERLADGAGQAAEDREHVALRRAGEERLGVAILRNCERGGEGQRRELESEGKEGTRGRGVEDDDDDEEKKEESRRRRGRKEGEEEEGRGGNAPPVSTSSSHAMHTQHTTSAHTTQLTALTLRACCPSSRRELRNKPRYSPERRSCATRPVRYGARTAVAMSCRASWPGTS